MSTDCLTCNLSTGVVDLPGGVIYSTPSWRVEHCIGPFPVGTLVVKPLRHVVHRSELDDVEAADVGPLLRDVTSVISALSRASQVYACLWSTGPAHIHFVLQPETPALVEEFGARGPKLQSALFSRGVLPERHEVEAFASRAREAMGTRRDHRE